MLAWIAVAASAAAVTSCSKKSSSNAAADPNKPHEETPKEYFVQSVYPRIAGEQACGACHAGGASPCSASSCMFIDTDAQTTYSRIEKTVGYISAPQKSPLLIYNHVDRTDPRTKLTGDQANVLGIWLGMEASSRNLPGALAKAKNLQDAYDQFAGVHELRRLRGHGHGEPPVHADRFRRTLHRLPLQGASRPLARRGSHPDLRVDEEVPVHPEVRRRPRRW